jgi:hypothetical protein
MTHLRTIWRRRQHDPVRLAAGGHSLSALRIVTDTSGAPSHGTLSGVPLVIVAIFLPSESDRVGFAAVHVEDWS